MVQAVGGFAAVDGRRVRADVEERVDLAHHRAGEEKADRRQSRAWRPTSTMPAIAYPRPWAGCCRSRRSADDAEDERGDGATDGDHEDERNPTAEERAEGQPRTRRTANARDGRRSNPR